MYHIDFSCYVAAEALVVVFYVANDYPTVCVEGNLVWYSPDAHSSSRRIVVAPRTATLLVVRTKATDTSLVAPTDFKYITWPTALYEASINITIMLSEIFHSGKSYLLKQIVLCRRSPSMS